MLRQMAISPSSWHRYIVEGEVAFILTYPFPKGGRYGTSEASTPQYGNEAASIWKWRYNVLVRSCQSVPAPKNPALGIADARNAWSDWAVPGLHKEKIRVSVAAGS